MKNRLSKVIAACGIASRRGAEELIFNGDVRVNSQTCLTPQTEVELGVDRIEVKGKPIKGVEKKVIYVLNKPKGYVCSQNRDQSKFLIYDLFPPEESRRLFTIGRLDKDTSGLILVTNDGEFAQQLIHPSSNITKEYVVKTVQPIRNEQLKLIQKGQFIEGRFIKPVKVTQENQYTLKVTVQEGKKHEVRLFVTRAGLRIEALKRIRIGSLKLLRMPLGIPKKISQKDLNSLTSSFKNKAK
ncbi:MAG: pseudouridine synthase [Rhabdochlamydiaceae bacterium]|nr:pseudouridine synthase [Candidatus Amphrikana amoebophyrae]